MIIAMTNQDGGAEKAMLACGMAVLCTMDGGKTLLIDADPMQTSFNWSMRRGRMGIRPSVAACSVEDRCLHSMLENLAPRYDDIIIDAGRHDSLSGRAALIAAQLAVIPVRPQDIDTEAQSALAIRIQAARFFNPRLRVHLVASDIPPTGMTFEERSRLRRLAAAIPAASVSSAIMPDEFALRQAFCHGRSAAEIADFNAEREAARLYHEIFPAGIGVVRRLRQMFTTAATGGIPQPSR